MILNIYIDGGMSQKESILQRLRALFVFADDQPFRIQWEPLQYVVHLGADVHLKVPVAPKNPDLVGVAEGSNAAAGPQNGKVIVVRVEHLVLSGAW